MFSGASDAASVASAVAIAEGNSIEEAAIVSNVAVRLAGAKIGTAVVSRSEFNSAIRRTGAASALQS
jgi:D-beta-D-heptose 7-phosphate kinase/D-beta-D-heptose 1-phosphate adenosyltransferase